MSGKTLFINFTFNISAEEYVEAVSALANDFAAVAGMRWKVWTINEAEKEAGGIYLFDDAASLQDFLAGPLVAAVTNHPALSDFTVKQFDVMEEATATTRGPV